MAGTRHEQVSHGPPFVPYGVVDLGRVERAAVVSPAGYQHAPVWETGAGVIAARARHGGSRAEGAIDTEKLSGGQGAGRPHAAGDQHAAVGKQRRAGSGALAGHAAD